MHIGSIKVVKKKIISQLDKPTDQPAVHSTSEWNTSFWLCDVIMYDVDAQLEYCICPMITYFISRRRIVRNCGFSLRCHHPCCGGIVDIGY